MQGKNRRMRCGQRRLVVDEWRAIRGSRSLRKIKEYISQNNPVCKQTTAQQQNSFNISTFLHTYSAPLQASAFQCQHSRHLLLGFRIPASPTNPSFSRPNPFSMLRSTMSRCGEGRRCWWATAIKRKRVRT